MTNGIFIVKFFQNIWLNSKNDIQLDNIHWKPKHKWIIYTMFPFELVFELYSLLWTSSHNQWSYKQWIIIKKTLFKHFSTFKIMILTWLRHGRLNKNSIVWSTSLLNYFLNTECIFDTRGTVNLSQNNRIIYKKSRFRYCALNKS